MTVIVGWDIGGVHLKAARAENGRIVEALQLASPLRHGLDALSAAFAEGKTRMGAADHHVLTMTGELADTFACRAEGVDALTALALRVLAPAPVSLYAGRAGFVSPDRAARHVEDVASANWYATATYVAGRHPAALFVDMGSTTTDIVPVREAKVSARGYTDAERLAVGELVYTGLVRSFVMATADRAPFAGRWVGLINENFATMADVHRILGSLPEEADQMPTADGRAKTIEASRARLARMVGHDAGDARDEAGAAWRSGSPRRRSAPSSTAPCWCCRPPTCRWKRRWSAPASARRSCARSRGGWGDGASASKRCSMPCPRCAHAPRSARPRRRWP